MADPKLKLGNDIWATKQKSLLAYNDEGGNFKSLPFQVDRISGGTYVGRNGLVQYAASNEPRVDFLNNTKGGLLLEPQRTNYTAYSAQFENSYWTKATSDTTANPTVTANAAIAPDGTQTADKVDLTAPSDNNWAVVKRDSINTGATVGSKLQQSLYLKAYDSSQVGKNVDIYMYDFSNTVYKTVYNYTLTADWERVIVEHTITGSNTSTNIQFAFGKARSSAGGSLQAETATDFLVWGSQLEKGSYPTSIIPTSSDAVTRVVDTCGSTDNLSTLIGQSEGTLFIDFEFFEQGTTSSYQMPIGLYNSGGSGTQNVRIDNYSGKLRIYIISSGGTIALWDSSNSISNVVANQRYKVAIRYKNGDSVSYVNGELYKSDSGAISGFNLVKMVFGYANFANTLMHRGKINESKFFNEGLTNSELATLTTI